MAVFTKTCRQKDSHVFITLSSGADGHISGSVDYDVFGEPVTETGVFAGYGGISALVFAYAGKPYDSVTGLSDYGFRDYAPAQARFTTVDPIRDGSNWYAYCNADPVNFVDMWGLRDILGYDPNKETLGDFKGSRSPTQTEMELYIAAGGNPNLNFDAIRIYDRLPTVREIRNAASEYGLDMSLYSDSDIKDYLDNDAGALSLPGGKVYAPKDKNLNGNRDTNEVLAVTAHEFEHQDQYSRLGAPNAFSELIIESQMQPPDPDPYTTNGYLENDANNIENKANELLRKGWTSSSNTQTQNSTGCNTH